MVEPTARIRPFESTDEKNVRFTIGKARMDMLAVANRSAYVHWMTLSLWVVASSVFIQYMHWWPEPELYGWYAYLRPIPAFASMAVPFMFGIDWFNRPHFEKLVQDALSGPDIANVLDYYARSPASGFWILEYGDKFVGLIGVDVSKDSTSDISLLDPVSGGKGGKKKDIKVFMSKGTSEVATIRHFVIDELYRPALIQDDLLVHAIKQTFGDKNVKTIRAFDSPLEEYVSDCLRDHGFKVTKEVRTVGVFKWKLTESVLRRSDWEKGVEKEE
ncbi:hypothetical protein JAAARDRAFT_53888 [Jaapia argillacea MUCL 33604]|uniref:N-acetyltransferase domain-containing protein n=1 Tax=Jaapia argillacea MUCL 33604 TaxID=933084 RepID=A0A067QJK4_9AGAM|nr:hypothetical protein JAAARDRAFT_53888 [Jaapia argillacea MUCL 33604]